MLQAIQWAAAGTGFTFLMTTLGAAMVFFFAGEPQPRFQRAMLGFAAGVMTAASVWSLLIPAIDQASAESALPGWLPAAGGMLLGVVFLAALDALLPRLRRKREEMTAGWKQTTLLVTAITLHNVPEGMAVGLAFALAAAGDGAAGAAALALGIGIQNFPEGAAIALPLRQNGWSRKKSFLGGALSGIVEPVFGVLVVLAAAGVRPLMPWLLSFAAGAMLYVVVEELIPQAHSRAGTCGFVLGFLIMMVLDVALG
ncbi:zinc transporter, ZIP family [Oscillibacter sp. PC13]|uniref:ZIP family metal transporter n=1 Tax=Oscillibacter sp. PC13 TaxID=1855299 RepID=UPI0008E64EC0|nr:ZIP family metal transporter [Oscillibacter sp. PC13]SFP50388.1 zinc transporter, ZIP family [Oscillibacter sp. PC13]